MLPAVFLRLLPAASCLALATVSLAADASRDYLRDYEVVWTTQSRNSSESMPCGGGDIGLNVWVENDELLFYLMRSGCFDENNEFLKLGRVRIRFSPDPINEFRQTLKLRQGHVEITGKSGGAGRFRVKVWVEVHRPVVHVDIDAENETQVEAAYEGWRNADLELPNDFKDSRFGCFAYDQYPGKVWRRKDSVEHRQDAVLWYHRNRNDRLVFDLAVRQQGLEAVKHQMWNPLKNRTFGGMLVGRGMRASGVDNGKYVLTPFRAWKLETKQPARSHSLKVFLHTDQAESLEAWKGRLEELARDVSPSDEEAWRKNLEWWSAFWERSYLVIQPDHPDPHSRPWQVGRNFQLFRYQLGSNAYGEFPTKFNGGLFTYDPSLVDTQRRHSPDWRAWGGGSFTAQNQRLVYWPMLKSGDFDLMRPQFEFYRRALENATLRVKTYWGHEGCLFTEQMSEFGLPIAATWGWDDPRARGRRRPKDTERGVQVNGAVRYHYESQLEFSYMILECYRFAGIDLGPYLPFIERSVRFFDEHYQMRARQRTGTPLDENGKLIIFPSTSCESYRGALNPSDLIAGLNACLKSLLDLPENYAPEEKKKYWRELSKRVPDYGIGEVDGRRIMNPAWSWTKYQNVECPQFYPLFPFDQFALGRSDMQLFKNTWELGTFPKGLVRSWHQDGIFFARMGMTREAAEYNTRKMQDSARRFPTFWGPGHDWVPDHNWGGSGMIAVEEMLLQTDGKTLRLLPAWPEDWDVDFRLHAPERTVVEGKVRGGKVIHLEVTPPERKRDVVIGADQ